MVGSADPESPLTPAAVAAALAAVPVQIPPIRLLSTVDSTNAEAARWAVAGAPDWSLVVAEQQSAGRGRLDRQWTAAAGDALLLSVILRVPPGMPAESVGWLPLLAGVAAVQAVTKSGLRVGLKWPNDVIVDAAARDGSAGPRKLAGILAERADTAVILGIGINVNSTAERLPTIQATSIRHETGRAVDRAQLLADLLSALREWWQRWLNAAGNALGSGLRDAYARSCVTIGRDVRIELPSGAALTGEVRGIDASGHLLVMERGSGSVHSVAAGDVIHVRLPT